MDQRAGRTAFLVHAAAFGIVCGALFALNAVSRPPAGEAREWWALWVFAGWGAGLAAHGLALALRRIGARGGLLAEAPIRAVIVHAFAYVAVNLILIALNLRETPHSIWFIWPLLGWGFGLAAHAWLAYRTVLRRTLERYAQEQRVLAEMERERLAAEALAAAQAREREEKAGREKRAGEAAQAAATAKKKPARKRKRAPAAAKSKSGTAKKAGTRKPGAKKAAARTPAARTQASAGKAAAAKKPASRRRSRRKSP
ncbi:MAG: hypothetical protein Kow0032_16300 [Methyloligellaceae bacterium]